MLYQFILYAIDYIYTYDYILYHLYTHNNNIHIYIYIYSMSYHIISYHIISYQLYIIYYIMYICIPAIFPSDPDWHAAWSLPEQDRVPRSEGRQGQGFWVCHSRKTMLEGFHRNLHEWKIPLNG